jgi:hypothetical protein
MNETNKKRLLVLVLILLVMIASAIFIGIQLDQGSQAPEDSSAEEHCGNPNQGCCGEKGSYYCNAGVIKEESEWGCDCKSNTPPPDECAGSNRKAGCTCNSDGDCQSGLVCVGENSKTCQGIGPGCSAYYLGNGCIRYLGLDCPGVEFRQSTPVPWTGGLETQGCEAHNPSLTQLVSGTDQVICTKAKECECNQVDSYGADGGGAADCFCIKPPSGNYEDCLKNLTCWQTGCTKNADCVDGTTCSNGRCVNASCPNESDCVCNVDVTCNQTCGANRNCSDGTTCINGRCRNSSCPNNSSCICIQDVTCNQVCDANNRCSDGTTCVDGRCRNESCPTESDCVCPTCGDGACDPGENCDGDANCITGGLFEAGECRADCTYCGDGQVEADEECDPFADDSGCHLGTTCQDDCTCIADAGCGEGCTQDTDCPSGQTCDNSICTLDICLIPGNCEGPCDPVSYPESLPETDLLSDKNSQLLFGILLILMSTLAIRFDLQTKLFHAFEQRFGKVYMSSEKLVINRRAQTDDFEKKVKGRS